MRFARARRVAVVVAKSGARFIRARSRCPRRIGKTMALKAVDPDALALLRDQVTHRCHHECADRCIQAVGRIALDDLFHAGFETVFHSKLFPVVVGKIACGGFEAFGLASSVAKALFAILVAWPHCT